MIKEAIQKGVSVVNVSHNMSTKYIKQKLWERKGKINNSRILLGDYTSLSTWRIRQKKLTYRSSNNMNNTLKDIYLSVSGHLEFPQFFMRIVYTHTHLFTIWPTMAKHTLLSHAHGTFTKIDYLLNHRAGLMDFKRLK